MITNVCAVMPAYNHAEFLNAAIDAVVPQVDILVVVNDGSTDNTQEIIDSREDIDKIIQYPNGGTAAAINQGIDWLRKNYSFEWLTWVSSDNVMHTDWIERELAAADKSDETVGVVYSSMHVMIEDNMKKRARGNMAHHTFHAYDPTRLHRGFVYFGCAFIIRQECWVPHDGQMGHDLYHWMRVEEQCWMRGMTIVGIPDELAEYRVHTGQISRWGHGSIRDAKKLWKEGLARRAQMGLKPPV